MKVKVKIYFLSSFLRILSFFFLNTKPKYTLAITNDSLDTCSIVACFRHICILQIILPPDLRFVCFTQSLFDRALLLKAF